jgi:hypothetical protein
LAFVITGSGEDVGDKVIAVDEPSGPENIQDVKDREFVDGIKSRGRNQGHWRSQCWW